MAEVLLYPKVQSENRNRFTSFTTSDVYYEEVKATDGTVILNRVYVTFVAAAATELAKFASLTIASTVTNLADGVTYVKKAAPGVSTWHSQTTAVVV